MNKKALDDNHEVVALVRSPEKIEIKHEKLKVIKCNIFRFEIIFISQIIRTILYGSYDMVHIVYGPDDTGHMLFTVYNI